MRIPDSFPKIVIFKEKHGDRCFIAASALDFVRIFAYIGYERAKEGYWYAEGQNKAIFENQSTGHITQIAEFVEKRKKHEYEGFEIETPEEVVYI